MRNSKKSKMIALVVAMVVILLAALLPSVASADEKSPSSTPSAQKTNVAEETPAPATNAKQGIGLKNDIYCHGRMASTRQDTWGNTMSVVLPPNNKFRFVVSSGLKYWFCPNNPPGPGNYPNIVMPLATLYCVTPVDLPTSPFYNGTTFDSQYWDANNNDINPVPKKLPASSEQRCRWQKIKKAKKEWMRMRDVPRQSTWVHLHQHTGQTDTERYMRWQAPDNHWHTVKPIQPANDAVMVPLHRIPKGQK